MQSDTIIGIVGAVVLVAVMIGVFAYEYNNTPDDVDDGGGSTDAAKMELFNATFPNLAAEEDLDGDDVPNYLDDDIDGDDIDNGNDSLIQRDITFSLSAPAHNSPTGNGGDSDAETIFIGTGFASYEVAVSHSTGGVLGQQGTFRAEVDAGGAGSCITGQDGTCSFDHQGADVTPGEEYDVVARQTAANPNGLDVDVVVTITYDAGRPDV